MTLKRIETTNNDLTSSYKLQRCTKRERETNLRLATIEIATHSMRLSRAGLTVREASGESLFENRLHQRLSSEPVSERPRSVVLRIEPLDSIAYR